ncbi:hypothetical protein DD565_09640, partial [Vibrio cholerae]
TLNRFQTFTFWQPTSQLLAL